MRIERARGNARDLTRKDYRMRKALLVVTFAAVACVSTAQAGPHEAVFNRARMSTEDIAAYADARIAALKAGLRLTPEQEKNWPALETALREAAKEQAARVEAWRDNTPPGLYEDPLGALQRRAKSMIARAGELDRIATAASPLYATLDSAQKRRFGALIRAALERRIRSTRLTGIGGFGSGPD
jgi:hypothetical protein